MKQPHEATVLVFDVFGTVVDWYGTVLEEGAALSAKTGVDVDWGSFALKWRLDGYIKVLIQIAKGEIDVIPTETMHRRMLDQLLPEVGITGLSEDEVADFNMVWNRLKPWEDAVEGLHMLKKHYQIMPFSNGDLGCMSEIAKRAGLPWDAIISADFFKKIKPDPTIYHDAVNLLQRNPDDVMMVAAHAKDLEGAQNAGMHVAYINRPDEYGPTIPNEEKHIRFDYDVDSLIELAQALEADRNA